MPCYCAAFGCSNHSLKKSCKERKVSFFRFPLHNSTLLKIWVLKIRRANFKPSASSRICSDHFTPDSFNYLSSLQKKTLRKDAVPTIFCFSKPEPERKCISNRFVASSTKDQSKLDLCLNQIRREDSVTSTPTIINVISPRNATASNVAEDKTFLQFERQISENHHSQALEPEVLLEESPGILVSSNISKPCTVDVAVQTDLGFDLVIDSLFEAKKRIEELESKIQERLSRFSPKFMSSDHLHCLTGFDKDTFFRIFDLLIVAEHLEGKKLAPEKQFLMFLIRLKTGLTYEVLAYLFEVTTATVGRTIQAVTDVVYQQFQTLIPNLSPEDETIDEYSTFIVWVQRMLSRVKE